MKLKWSMRYQLALGIAEGLLYLHEGCQRRFIHRDIKASNILLTEDFQPQVPFQSSHLEHKTYTICFIHSQILLELGLLRVTYYSSIQICDFGLAKWLPEQWTHHTISSFEGTFGFVDLILVL